MDVLMEVPASLISLVEIPNMYTEGSNGRTAPGPFGLTTNRLTHPKKILN